MDGYAYCLNANNGRLVWKTQVGTTEVDYTVSGSSPAVENGRVYIIGQYAYCLDARTGDVIWSTSIRTAGNASPTLANGYVYIGYSRIGWGRLDCLDAETGNTVWSFSCGAVISTPSIAYGKVYFGTCDDNMYCLNALTGALIWSYHAGGWEIRSSPAVASGRVYFTDDNLDNINGKIFCLDADTGQPIWTHITGCIGGVSSPAIAYDTMYVAAGNTIYAFK
jgi:outer membrane protein assembly factor BamB